MPDEYAWSDASALYQAANGELGSPSTDSAFAYLRAALDSPRGPSLARWILITLEDLRASQEESQS